MSHSKRNQKPNQEEDEPTKKHQRSEESHLLEEGHVYIFYRSKVDTEEAEDLQDVQRTIMITIPRYVKDEQGRTTPAARLFILPKKKFPDVGSHDRFTCVVEDIFQSIDEVRKYLKESHYSTKTRGERTNPKSTLVAAGVYGFVAHDGHSHLVLALDESSEEQTSNVWPEFNLTPTASYILQVKAPGVEGPPNTMAQDADFPQDLREKFGDYRWISIDTTRFLDFPKCLLLLVGARRDIVRELRDAAEEVQQQEAHDFSENPDKTRKTALSELSLKPSDVRLGPLYGEFD